MIEAIDIRHGYTLADLDRMARAAVQMAWPRAMDYRERYETAWSAIAEHLCATDEEPVERDLKLVGCNAVNRLAQDHGRHWGLDRNNAGAGFESARNFLRYWELSRRATGSPENGVVERLALAQIWPHLSDTHRMVLAAMAVHADNVIAAESVGKTYATFNTHLMSARRRFLTHWHQGETPSRFWGKGDRRHGRRSGIQVLANRSQQRARRPAQAPKDPGKSRTRCGNGHELTSDNVGVNGRCKTCARERQRRCRFRQEAARGDVFGVDADTCLTIVEAS